MDELYCTLCIYKANYVPDLTLISPYCLLYHLLPLYFSSKSVLKSYLFLRSDIRDCHFTPFLFSLPFKFAILPLHYAVPGWID